MKFKCPNCGRTLRKGDGLADFECPGCGKEYDEADDGFITDGSHIWDSDGDEVEGSDDDIPFACQTCGGPFPNCKDNCPVYDD